MAFIAIGLLIAIGCLFYIFTFNIHGVSFWNFLFAALKLNLPNSEVDSNWVYGVYLLLGILATMMIPFVTAVLTEWHRAKVSLIREGRDIHEDIKEHYVIIGFNPYTLQVLRHCLKENSRKAIIMTPFNPYIVREKINNGLSKAMSQRVILYAGDAIEKEKVESLNLRYAQKLYLLDESDGQDSQYLRNVSILKAVVDCVADRIHPLEVYMQVNNSKAYNLLQRVDLPVDFFRRGENIVVDFRPFNFYENWARLLWSYHKLEKYDTLDFEPLENSNQHVHLVISGFNDMGQALILEALRLCHYPNYKESTGANQTVISVFDARMDAQLDAFKAQYPNLQEIRDVQIEFIHSDIHSAESRVLLDQWARDNAQLLTIAICDPEADVAMTNALNLPQSVYYLTNGNPRTRVLVRQALERATDDVFSSINQEAYPHLQLFGSIEEGLCFSQLDDRIAICINGIYEVYSKSPDECTKHIRSVFAQKENETEWRKRWLNLPENKKWANRFQADIYKLYIDTMTRSSGMCDILPDMEHRRWCAERILAGWRQKAPDGERVNSHRIHDMIIPYSQLDDKEKEKDYNVIATAQLIAQEAEKLGGL